MKIHKVGKRMRCVFRLSYGIILAGIIAMVHAEDTTECSALCYQQYYQLIRQQTAALSVQLRHKIAARSILLEQELEKDQGYQDEIEVLKEEKKQKGNSNSTGTAEKFQVARRSALQRLASKPAIMQVNIEINTLRKEMEAVVKDILGDDDVCRRCLTEQAYGY